MSAIENTDLIARLKALSEKHNKAIATLERIAFAKLHIWTKKDLSDWAMNELVALGEYQRVTDPANNAIYQPDAVKPL